MESVCSETAFVIIAWFAAGLFIGVLAGICFGPATKGKPTCPNA